MQNNGALRPNIESAIEDVINIVEDNNVPLTNPNKNYLYLSCSI